MAYIIVVQPAVLSGKWFGTERPRVWCCHDSDMYLSGAGYGDHGSLRAVPDRAGARDGRKFLLCFFSASGGGSSKLGQRTASGARRGVRFRCAILILSLIGLRELIFNSITPSLKNGIAAGIGLFIAFIGLPQATVIGEGPGTAMNEHALCVA